MKETKSYKVISVSADEHPGNRYLSHCVAVKAELQMNEAEMVTERFYTDDRLVWRFISFLKSVGVWQDGMSVKEAVESCIDQTGTLIYDSALNAVLRYLPADHILDASQAV